MRPSVILIISTLPLLIASAPVSEPEGEVDGLVGSTNSPISQYLPAGRPFSTRQCLMCRFSISLVNYALRTQRGADQVIRIANSYCNIAHIQSPLVCSNITKLFSGEIVKVLSYGLFTPNQICGYLSNNTCGTFYDPLADWEVNLNTSIHLSQEELAKKRMIELQSRRNQRPYRVIHISDTHIDLSYAKGSLSLCDEPLCCRSTSSKSNSSHLLEPAGAWGSYGSCDVPMATLESALKLINETMTESKSDIDYVLWTGDIQPHDVWDQSKKNAARTYDAVFATIFKYLPRAVIYPTLGNHEMIPVDSFSPSNLLDIARDDSPEWLYRKMDSYWSTWLPYDTVKTITKDGFYAATVRTGLKVISLNTNFCHSNNFWLYINSTDPGNQLQWLVHELQLSELEHEQVHIIGHIPPGGNDCMKVWSRNYNRIVRRFAKTVGGQFFGHTHNNEFEMFYDDVSMKPISVGFIGPSITTFIGVNPSYRIYTIDPSQGYRPIDFETIYFNLTQANLVGKPDWTSTGAFSQEFGIQDTSPMNMHNLLMSMATDDGSLLKLYRLFYAYSDMYGSAEFKKMSLDARRAFLCKFFTAQSHDDFACRAFIKPT